MGAIGRVCLLAMCLMMISATIGPMLGIGVSFKAGARDAATQYNLYFGDLHSHTGFSDGMGTPDMAYAAARAAGADFLAVTDHYFELNDAEWAGMISSANEYTVGGEFIAMAAYEYYLVGINEINVYGTETMAPHPGLTPNAQYSGDRMDGGSFLPWFYDWIAREPGAIGQWNHPLSYGCPVAWDYFQFAFVNEERDAGMGMLEIFNGYIRESSYIKALDNGWHMMPTATADTHMDDWISGYEMRTVLLAPSLNRDDLYDAMRCGRGYATLDSDLRVTYTLNGQAMGSILSPGGLAFEACIHVEDPSGDSTDAITLVEIVSDGGEVVWSWDLQDHPSLIFDETVVLESDASTYYYVRVSTLSNEVGLPGYTAWTAPVWTGR